MRKLLVLFALLFIAVALEAQTCQGGTTCKGSITATNTTCTAGVCVLLPLPTNTGAGTITVSGTYSATLQFEGSGDRINYANVNCFPSSGGAAASSTTGVGTWQCSLAGYTALRVRGSAFASGTAVVTIYASPADVSSTNGMITDAAGLNVHGTTANSFHCVVAVSTATSLQAVGGSCIAPGAGLRLYLTDIAFGTSAAAGTAADSFPTLKSGTGGTCGTATAVIWQALTTANSTVIANHSTPIKLTANSEICWIMTTAGSKTLQLSGFIAP